MRQPTSLDTSEKELAAIRHELNEPRPMRQELNELREAFTLLRSNGNGSGSCRSNGTSFLEAESTAVTDRRGMLRKVGALAAGIAAASLLRPAIARADSGDSLVMGNDNNHATDTGRTSVTRSGGAGSTLAPALFRVDNFATNYLLNPPNGDHTAILAHINNLNQATNTGNFYALFAAATAPVGGTAIGAHGEGDDIGVEGIGTIGVFGSSGVSNGAGVRGEANSGTAAHAVEGISTSGVGGDFQGPRAALYLESGAGAVADPNLNPPSGGTFGDVYRGSTNASVWYRASGTNPYRRLADSTTAGALTTFAVPSVFVNTITGSGNTYDGQHITANSVKTYQIGGVTFGGNAVPSDARAVIGRIADPNPAGTGALLVAGANPPPAGTGVIAVAPGTPENSAFISALDATGKLYVKGAFAAGSTDVIIIIGGYYL